MRFKALCVTLLLMATSTSSPSFAATQPPKIAVWSEFLPYSEVRGYLPDLQRRDIALHVAVREPFDKMEGFAELWTEAQRLGVEIRPWLLLPEADGYWFNKWNTAASQRCVEHFLSWMGERGLPVQWVTLDLEPPPEFLRTIQGKLDAANLFGAIRLLRESSRKGSIRDAQAFSTRLVEGLHARGIQVHAVTNPIVLHDVDDGRMRVQSALGTAVEGVPWDQVSFMVYRAEFQKAWKAISERIVYRYALRAKKYFGDRAAIDLGEIGPVLFPEPFQGYSQPSEIQADISAAAAAGITRMNVYSLDGMTRMEGPMADKVDAWLVPARAPRRPASQFWSWLVWTAMEFVTGMLPGSPSASSS
jgi:hypothetical protein